MSVLFSTKTELTPIICYSSRLFGDESEIAVEPHLGVQIVYLNRLRFRDVKPLSRDIPLEREGTPGSSKETVALTRRQTERKDDDP